ncbi:unnamed protein product [Dovyalis caffra]|uniref:Uncharacterized protein n=1 Tax=Dovyalis caffra TaxID=77055 RepID=A0AAV1RRI0_9ROSI|nr:unnamed protein product [Dovyalis caffra]
MAYVVPIINVVADAFCVLYPVELIFKKKCRGLFEAHFEVLDFFYRAFIARGRVHQRESSDRTALLFDSS